jgi:sterol desaturase/sphingolipid hydroxylase (fatty acid hydroxylase superfamily)
LAAIVIVGSLLIVALWELLRPRRRREFPSLRRRLGNIGFWLTDMALAMVLLGPAAPFRAHLTADFGLALPAWPLGAGAAGFVAAFLLLDLMRYAIHRIEHKVPLLWRFHALHHTDPDVDITTSVRHHPFEYLFSSVIFWGTFVALDIPPGAVLVHGLAVFAAAAGQHGNIRLPQAVERLLQPVVLTPDLHRIHHSIAVPEANANYGAVLSLWDRLFGTLVSLPPAQHAALVFGVAELPRAEGCKPWAMLMTPWRLKRAMRAITSAGRPTPVTRVRQRPQNAARGNGTRGTARAARR